MGQSVVVYDGPKGGEAIRHLILGFEAATVFSGLGSGIFGTGLLAEPSLEPEQFIRLEELPHRHALEVRLGAVENCAVVVERARAVGFSAVSQASHARRVVQEVLDDIAQQVRFGPHRTKLVDCFFETNLQRAGVDPVSYQLRLRFILEADLPP